MFSKTFLAVMAASVWAFEVFAATVSGTVTDTAGNAVANATVSLAAAQTATTTTNNTGQFRFANVAVGNYLLVASRQGYQQSAGELVRVASADTAITVNIELTPTGVTPPSGQGTVRGTVTDAQTDSALAGVLAVLAEFQMAGGTITYVPIDSARTDTAGTFEFDSLDNGQYQVSVIAAGYRTETQQAGITQNTRERTLTFALTAIETGSITGTVTGDSAEGAALVGASVVLSLRMGGGATSAVDSAVANNQGVYTFTNVEAGRNYVLTASKDGYETGGVRHDGQTAGTDTVDIVLIKQASGSLAVLVAKQSDSSALAGAQVAVTPQGATVPVATAAAGNTGWVNFSDLPTGTYSITVSLAGHTSRTVSDVINRDDHDTVRVYLAAASAGTKVFRGAITDSAGGAAVAGALVVLRVTSAGGSLMLFDSTDAQGRYSIAGIPVNTTLGTLTATADTYRDFSRQVTIGQPTEADTTTYNFKMVRLTTGAIGLAGANRGVPLVVQRGSMLTVSGFAGRTEVSVYSSQGRLVHRAVFERGTYAVSLREVLPSGGRYVVRVNGAGAALVRSIAVR